MQVEDRAIRFRGSRFLLFRSPVIAGSQSGLSQAQYEGRLLVLGWLLLLCGLLVRLERFLLAFPLWQDEAFVALNCVHRDYRGLMQHLQFGQVVPLGFLWAEHTIWRLFGASELSMRLVPLVLGGSGLWLVWWLTRRSLSPLAAVLTVGTLSVSMWPISMSCSVKPYSADLFSSALLTAAAVSWFHRPDRPGRMLLLALVAPLALVLSYPAVFVAGGVSLALFWTVCRTGCWRVKGLYLLFNVLMVGSFLGHYELIGREQINPQKSDIHAYLLGCWSDGFPPESLLEWPLWWLDQQTGRMLAYPCGDSHGGSSISFGLFLVGCAALWKARRHTLLALLLAPFALNLLAAYLHKYPYGSCGRVSQHLAPASCVLVGTGMAALLDHFTRSLRFRLHSARIVGAIFLIALLAVAMFQAYRPYRSHDDAPWTRGIVRQLMSQAKASEPVVLSSDELTQQNGAVLWWYLSTQEHPVTWAGDLGKDIGSLPGTGSVWICDHRKGANATPRQDEVERWACRSGRHALAVASWFFTPYHYPLETGQRVDLYFCVPQGQQVNRPIFSQWPEP